MPATRIWSPAFDLFYGFLFCNNPDLGDGSIHPAHENHKAFRHPGSQER